MTGPTGRPDEPQARLGEGLSSYDLARRAQRNAHGHYWTFGTFVRRRLWPLSLDAASAPFRASLRDPVAGEVPVTGQLSVPATETRELLVVLHGLGGDVNGSYVVPAAIAAHRAGIACLRLNLRGADRSGIDVYHAGLTNDLTAALSAPELARFDHIYILGYSLGGHVTLRWAAEHARGEHRIPFTFQGLRPRGPGAEPPEGARGPAVRAVSSICAPLDLAAGVRAIQRLDRLPYQYNVLVGLKDHYSRVVRRWGAGTPNAPISEARAMRIRTIMEWDELVIAPRFGWPSTQRYYEEAGVGPLLPDIELPTLFVAAEADPMIPPFTLRPALARASPSVRAVFTSRGGHVGFPDDLTLGLVEGTTPGLEREVLAWLRSHATGPLCQ